VALLKRTACLLTFLFFLAGGAAPSRAQEPASKPAGKADEQTAAEKEKSSGKPELPFQIQLLETQVRFEANGDSRKEVHTVVKIINILGAQQFARIAFDYNRSFQQIEIPMVRVSHANGGMSEVLPSAVTDAPNPAVQQFPVYHDVRVKSVRILGLEEGDTVEYRVITTTTKHPLAPDFWLEHSFDRSGQVLEEHYELDLPGSRQVEPRINPKAPPSAKEITGAGENARTIYRWTRIYSAPAKGDAGEAPAPDVSAAPDVGVSTFSWEQLAARLAERLLPGSKPMREMKTHEEEMKELSRRPEVADAVREKAISLARDSKSDLDRMKAIYQFVSTQIGTVDLPLGTTGFRSRPAADILNSGYATGEDKYVLLAALGAAVNLRADAVLTGFCDKKALAIPGAFKHLVILGTTKERQYWMDPAVEVAPFGMISPTEAKCALLLRRESIALNSPGHEWIRTPTEPPFAAFQKVGVDAVLTDTGQLTAKVKYVLRGENELLLRVAFHQAPKEKWKDIGTLLAISDGFRGQVTSADASDPLATDEPFTVEYEITQLKFVDWSKKPVRIPALLPQIALPDPPAGAAPGKIAPKIELGTPLDVQTSMTLRLPAGTTVQTPAGTTMSRDYATYTSKYSSAQNTVVGSRRIDFLKREILGDRAMDYDAFLRAVQNDQAQRFTLVVGEDGARP
jgi:Domain of Unknown Function with PDB structure (DUF3857)